MQDNKQRDGFRGQELSEHADDTGAPPDLSRNEDEQIERRSAPRAAVVYETIRREGEDELERPAAALAWSALAAGLSMGFSLLAQGLLRESLPDTPWEQVITPFGYSIGFLIVILGRQQLFTENTLTPILPLLARRDRATLRRVLRLWAIVFGANLAGTLIFAAVVGNTNVFEQELKTTLDTLSLEMIDISFSTALLRGIFSGWLIALMVWLLPFAETARVGVIILITYLVGLAHLSHSIAGSVEGFYVVLRGHHGLLEFLGSFLLPTLIGNIVGGVALVAMLNYAQVFSGNAAAQPGKGEDS